LIVAKAGKERITVLASSKGHESKKCLQPS
ncbi:hypothetical protein CCACVL1_09017, partial [Corchorus capsularis]